MVGGRPALAKKVTAEMDSDDELIVQMKQARYQEKDIAQRLIDEGHYHPKTIGTRWARLKKVMQVRNDELLDADLTDWHEGDVLQTPLRMTHFAILIASRMRFSQKQSQRRMPKSRGSSKRLTQRSGAW